ncbi:c-type cytochrome [Fulvimarina sp. MAC8]|uniref:c-type cytochrome n=1 Tax=Fulvimarina sp. MAC8 TaxID=3162874 RepID=UPI0032F037F1
MNHNTLAGLAGALLLSTAGFAFAQGTTVLPAGQSASNIQVAQNDATGTTQTEGGAAAAAATSEDTEPTAAEEADSSEDSEAAAEEASDSAETEAAQSSDGGESSGDGEGQMQSGLEVDAHPSADTEAEGNAVSETKPADADQTPGLALDSAGNPVYALADGGADWYTWRGYKKYGANCLQCHGPDGMGSSFAPNLTESIQDLSYYDFAGIIVSGQQNKWSSSGNSIMPAWGEDPNVMCSLDAIYVYLRGRTDGVVGRGEPKRPEKTDLTKAAQDHEYSCLGF